MSGGAVWTFYTLYDGVAKESFNKFTIQNVLDFDTDLKIISKSLKTKL